MADSGGILRGNDVTLSGEAPTCPRAMYGHNRRSDEISCSVAIHSDQEHVIVADGIEPVM